MSSIITKNQLGHQVTNSERKAHAIDYSNIISVRRNLEETHIKNTDNDQTCTNKETNWDYLLNNSPTARYGAKYLQ